MAAWGWLADRVLPGAIVSAFSTVLYLALNRRAVAKATDSQTRELKQHIDGHRPRLEELAERRHEGK